MKTIVRSALRSPDSKSDSAIHHKVTTLQDFKVLQKSFIALAILSFAFEADAALVSPCSGVSLEPSIITDLLDDALSPTVGVLDTVALNPILGLVFPGLTSGLNTTLTSFLNGGPIGLDVLATDGTVVNPGDECEVQSDSFTLETPKGISIGGNQITGLGNGLEANAGEINSIAFGNNAITDAAALNSIAIGPDAEIGPGGTNSIALGSNANATVANSVAIGADSLANVGAQSNYTAFALPTTQTSVGEVSVGSAGNERKITNVAAGSTATDAVNVSQLQAVSDNAVKYDPDPLNLRMSVTLEGPTSTDGGTTGGTRITNLAKGDVSNALSTDAVNGSQLFAVDNKVNSLGLTMATNLGGGATYNSVTGAVTAPTYNVGGTIQNNVGDAITALQTQSPVRYSDSSGTVTNIVSNDVTLVGSTTDPVRLHNLAAGVVDTDAVNVSQLNAVSNQVTTVSNQVNVLDGLAVKYTNTNYDTISLAGTNGTRITNLADGEVSATSTEAVNGSQLFNLTQGISTNIDALGNSTASNLGGGASYDPNTGIVSAPSYTVYGTQQDNVGDAIAALQSAAPIQYSDSDGIPTGNVTNDVTLVGAVTGPVGLHNVAAGEISATSTDAINGSQLFNLTSSTIRYFQINSTLGEADASNGVNTMAIGPLAVASGVASLALGVSSQATADGAVSLGVDSLASGVGSVALGANSEASEVGAVAIGQNSAATGVNAIAIGNGALATGSVAVGAGAQAGNDGAAFGDNAIALAPQQGTAIGNAAVVTANRGVALGASSSASRAGMGTTGARERFTNTAVTSTEGAVSVGDVGAERQITNVAGGTEATDAVNVRQLDAAIAQSSVDINNQLYGLKADLSALRHDSNAGTAAAMALASMPQSVIPGKVMLAAGAANYEGQSAMSIGISNFSENGRWVVNFNGSANTRGKAGAAVGVGFHW